MPLGGTGAAAAQSRRHDREPRRKHLRAGTQQGPGGEHAREPGGDPAQPGRHTTEPARRAPGDGERHGRSRRAGRACDPVPASASLNSLADRHRSAGQLLERGEDRGLRGRRHHRPLGPERRRLLGEDLGDDRLRAGAGEGRLAGQHLVRHGAERVDVAAGADLPVAHRLLGRHVRRRAERHPGLGHPVAAGLLHGEGDAEVGDQGGPVLEQDVLRLDVAVDHALAVGVVQRGRDLPRQPQGLVHRELLLPGQPRPQRFAGDVGHDVVEQSVGLARVDQAEDVRVLEVGGDLDLAEEALAAEDGGELGVEDLDGDLAAVLQVFGEIDRGHAALAQLAVTT